MKLALLATICVAVLLQGCLAIEKCDTKADLLIVIGEIKTGLNDTSIDDWFPNPITAALNDSVRLAPEALRLDVLNVANITASYDEELEEASKIALQTIKLQIDSIQGLHLIEDLINSADKQFSDPKVIEASCIVIKEALKVALEQRDQTLTCAEALKHNVSPKHDAILADVQRVTQIVQDKETHEFTDAKNKQAIEELRALQQVINDAIHADDEDIEDASDKYKTCLYKKTFNVEMNFAKYYGNFEIIINGPPHA